MWVFGLMACGQVPDHATDPTIAQESCWSCHGGLYLATTEPDHVSAALPHSCETCHETTAWRPARFPDHDPYWPLTGAHTTAECAECHVDGRYAGTPRACVGCHQDAFDESVNPPHLADSFPTSCEGCHETAAWRPGTVDDHDRFWVLEGAHVAQDCAACHDPEAWAEAPRECVGCHVADYQGTTDPDHEASGYPTSCAVCHTAAAWRPADFRDHDLYWPLEGRHLEAACEACHADDRYQGTPRDCEGCHLADYDATTAPDHADAGLPTACAGCHSPEGWSPAGFDVHDDFWPLEGRHAETGCAECHADGVYAGTPTTCDDCHHVDFVAAEEPDHEDLGYPIACDLCHTPTGWESSFDHDVTWPLTGEHLSAECADCHVDGVYTDTPKTCDGCHLADYDATTAPPHAASELGHDCESCHQTTGWTPASLDHDLFWALEGKHTEAGCADCHEGGLYDGTATLCDGCHAADYDATLAPPHAASELGRDCDSCHTPSGWAPAELNHGLFWALEGAHTEASCADCHVDGVYEGTARACLGCHEEDYDQSEEPPHLASGYPTDCERCHDSAAWTPNTFDHASHWPLLGAHATTTCGECHPGGQFDDTPELCVACHLADFEGASEPPHEASTFGQDCASCHVEAGWSPSTFDHLDIWPITGRHATASCVSCHVGGAYADTASTCEGCHLPDYSLSEDPPHAAQGFPTDCVSCHVTSGWEPASFDHESHWPLLGEHATTACSACHVGGQFTGTPEVCAGCHLGDFDDATAPIHDPVTFGQDCASCHTEAGWTPSSFDHGPIWPITGAHLTATCGSCHEGGDYTDTPSACDGCHHGDYLETTSPAHADNLLPTDCASCHATSAWEPATFDHDAVWPLVGEHLAATCVACHVGGAFAGTPDTCDGCHHQDYVDTTAPVHVEAGFATTCETCHSPSGWDGADFDHGQLWPLTGQHASVSCAECHADGYAGTPTSCDGCHHDDYLGTSAPAHADSGFPTDCQACHDTASWTGATFDHDAFWPLTGAHTAASCDGCHGGGTYAGTPTSCDSCHHADYTGATNPSHVALSLPTTCQSCHGTTSWATTSFPGHDTLFLISSGDHRDFSCAQCHPNAPVAWSDYICVTCHTGEHSLSKMNAEHDEVGDYSTRMATYPSYDAACLSCHPLGVAEDD